MKQYENNRQQPMHIRALAFETLEARRVLAVTFHGGATMPNVEAQAVYFGSDWKTNSALVLQKGSVEGFVRYAVNSPYMDMLHNAGYGVNRGTADAGYVHNKTLNKANFLTDLQIQADLQKMITSKVVKEVDANRLYIVFVEPGVAVKDTSDGSTSINDFLGYHGAFGGTNAAGKAADIHYAVITYPGGRNPSAAAEGYNRNLDFLTSVASHEIAEAVTDPNVGYSKLGWYDDSLDGEIGDIVSGDVVLHTYCMQKIASKSEKAMSPVGSTAYVFTAPVALLSAAAPTTTPSNAKSSQIAPEVLEPPINHALLAAALESLLASHYQARDTFFDELQL